MALISRDEAIRTGVIIPWLRATGFENIDSRPLQAIARKRLLRQRSNPITAQIEQELFGRKR